MAEIPLGILQRRAPRGPGYQPAGVVSLPRFEAPSGDIAGAIGQAGAAVSRTLSGVAAHQQRERDAADTITVQDQTAQFTDRLLNAQQDLLADQSIPPLELRSRLEARRQEYLEEFTAKLPARVQPRFQALARGAAVQPLYTIDQMGVQRLGEQAKATLEQRSDQLLRQTLQAPSEAARKDLLTQYDAVIDDYAQQGLLAPAQAPILKQQQRDKVVVSQMETFIRQDPEGALKQFLTGPEGNAAIPPAELPRLTDQAYSTLARQVSMQEASEAKARRTLESQQSQQASTYRMQVYKPGTSVEELNALVGPINQDRAAGRLSEEDHADLLQTVTTLTGKLTDDQYKDRNVPAVQQQLGILIETADTPALLAEARAAVLKSQGSLSAETTQTMLARIDTRRESRTYTKRDAYTEGRQLMLAGAFPGGIVPAVMDQLDDKTRRSTALALQVYAEQMEQIYQTEGATIGDQKAREVAIKLRDLYFPKPDIPKEVPGIPQALQGKFTTLEEAASYLESSDLPEALKDQYYLQFRTHLPRAQAQTMEQEYRQEFATRFPPKGSEVGKTPERPPGLTAEPPASAEQELREMEQRLGPVKEAP